MYIDADSGFSTFLLRLTFAESCLVNFGNMVAEYGKFGIAQFNQLTGRTFFIGCTV